VQTEESEPQHRYQPALPKRRRGSGHASFLPQGSLKLTPSTAVRSGTQTTRGGGLAGHSTYTHDMSEAHQRTDGRTQAATSSRSPVRVRTACNKREHRGSADRSAIEYARTRHLCCLAECPCATPSPRSRHFSSCPTCAAHRERDATDRDGQARRHSGPNTPQGSRAATHTRTCPLLRCLHCTFARV